jgi:hypothetical protein
MKKVCVCLWLVLLPVACTDDKLPLAPTPVAGPTPPVVTPPLPTTVPGVLAIGLPIDSADLSLAAFGMAPFGYHGPDHAENGHAGWDIEYRIGSQVRAAALGTVQAVLPDPSFPGRFSLHLEHIVGTHHYRTVYTNLVSVNADVIEAETVAAGQPLGIAGTIIAGGPGVLRPLPYAMSHFQIDDLEYYREIANPNAVSPEPFLTAEAKSLFDRMWPNAHVSYELVEPFATNPRDLAFPASRTWTRAGGDGPAGIRFIRRFERDTALEYQLLAESGTVVEAGTVQLTPGGIDFVSPASRRLGAYDIVSNEMRLSLAAPGLPRPAELSGAGVYRTNGSR